jgi:hypothetical protein
MDGHTRSESNGDVSGSTQATTAIEQVLALSDSTAVSSSGQATLQR